MIFEHLKGLLINSFIHFVQKKFGTPNFCYCFMTNELDDKNV